MNFRQHLIPLGAWAALILGLFYLAAYFASGHKINLAVALSCLSLSLSIKAYGNSTPKAPSRRKRKPGAVKT